MTAGNKQSIANAPIEVTPRSKWGVKLHGIKLEYYADPTNGDSIMVSWPQGDVIFCKNEEGLIEVIGALCTRLSTEAHKRVAEPEEQIG